MKKRFLSLFLAIAMLMSLSVVASAAGTVKDISSYVINEFDFNNDTAAGETERWTSGSHNIAVDGTVQTISGTGDTSNSKAVFYGLKKDGSYTAVPILDQADDNKIFRISFEFTNKSSANAKMQLGFNPLKSDGGSNGRNFIYMFNLSNGEITSAGGEKATVTAPVDTTVDVTMVMDLKSGSSRLYVGKDKYISNSNVFQTSGRNLKSMLFWVDQAVSYNYQVKDLEFAVYSAETTMDEVAAYAYARSDELYDPNQKPEEPDEPEEEPEVEITDETDNVLYTGVKYMSDYALSGYDNKQINNNWANISLSDKTDKNGVITTTATYSGSLAAGQRVASFQPWEKKKGTYTSAAGAYTMHFGFTVNELNSPLCLAYRFNADKKLISFSDKKVVWGSNMDGNTYIEVTAPYTIDIFMNIQSCKGIIYVNGEVLYDGTIANASRFYNSSSDTQWTEVRVTNLQEATDIKFVSTKATTSIFNDKVIFEDVVEYIMNKQAAAKTNWLWQINGINVGHELMHGAVDGLCSITGNNTDGYVLQPTSINENHYGFARFFLSTESGKALPQSDKDKVLWQSFEYNPTVLTNGQIFEIRGNNAWQTLLTAVPATETEPAYLKANVDGSKICNLDPTKFYKIDFIVNNTGNYEYYILVDGKVAAHNAIWDSRIPLWNTVFSSFTTDEKMTLKNLKTTLYEDSVSILDVLKKAITGVEANISDVVYDEVAKELTVTAALVGDETAFETGDLIYVAYDANGHLITIDVAEATCDDVNATEFGRAYPYGFISLEDVAEGETITLKAFLWDSIQGSKAISSVAEYTYTVPTTTVE